MRLRLTAIQRGSQISGHKKKEEILNFNTLYFFFFFFLNLFHAVFHVFVTF